MSPGSLDDAGRGVLAEAIRDVEGRSSAEVVIAVRARTGSYLHLYLGVGAVAAFAVLAFLLFSPWEYSLPAILTFPPMAGAAAGLLVSVSPSIVRLLSRRATIRRRVGEAARATFVRKRVHQTRGRTGVLVYVSWLERAVAVVPDVGVEAGVPAERWTEAVARIEAAATQSAHAVEPIARAIAGLGDVLAAALPRAADDVNELPDEVAEA